MCLIFDPCPHARARAGNLIIQCLTRRRSGKSPVSGGKNRVGMAISWQFPVAKRPPESISQYCYRQALTIGNKSCTTRPDARPPSGSKSILAMRSWKATQWTSRGSSTVGAPIAEQALCMRCGGEIGRGALHTDVRLGRSLSNQVALRDPLGSVLLCPQQEVLPPKRFLYSVSYKNL